MGNKKDLLNNIIPVSLGMKLIGDASSFTIDMLKRKALYQIDLTGHSYFLEDVIVKFFPDLIYNVDMGFNESGYFVNKRLSDNVDNYKIITHRGTPILLTMKPECRQEGNYSNTVVNMFISTINTKNHKRNMYNFIHLMLKHRYQKSMTDINKEIRVLSPNCNTRFYSVEKSYTRDFNSVFIPKDKKDLIMSSIRKYISKYDWYKEKKIPNHFGILLYGGPGMGKTSIAQAIAEEIGALLHVMNGDNLGSLNDVINGGLNIRPFSKNEYRILLIEDIDCGVLSLDRDDDKKINNNDNNNQKIGLGTVLNILDGINSPTNIIYIFTTNHIEKLDTALIRPGRIDLHVEIGPVCNETLDYFCMYHYNKHIPKDLIIKDNITFAQLQVEVMRDKTFEELIEFVKA